ncbi:protein kinase domain-containing protein [Actinoplanes sp. CA-015351]|uniref:protein kinase domain-containing protein n=1 Tax=Actinoplanes sp. CA-015351 TaxID=3239897 RepID=UPI003D96B89E
MLPSIIAERYRLTGRIGQGGMGRVWAARDELLGRDVAIKELVPPPGLTESELRTLRDRAIREARAIARLDQANVVRVHDVVFHADVPWIVMELVESRSLYQVVRAEGPMAPEMAARIGLGVLAGLRAAHRAGILHRDVKPGNVLLAHDGRVVLTDFGLATAAGDSSMTSTGVVLGSPSYLAPERALDGEIGPAADLWSLGATLYAAVEGRPPYDRSSPMATLTALATELPAPPERAGSLRPALIALLQKNPAERADAETAQRLLVAAMVGARPAPRAAAFQDQEPRVRTKAPEVPEEQPATRPAVASEGGESPEVAATLSEGAADAVVGLTSVPKKSRRRTALLAAAGLIALGLAAQPVVGALVGGDPAPAEVVPGANPQPGISGAAGGSGATIAPGPVPSSVPVKAANPGKSGRVPAPTVSGAAATRTTVAAATTTAGSGTVVTTAPGKATTATASSATTAATAVGREIKSMGTGTCLQATAARVVLNACTGVTEQRFSFPGDGTLRVGGRCVQIGDSGDGTLLETATCTASAAQMFTYNSSYDLVSEWAVKCVDVPDASTADGVRAQIWECTGASHQKWSY